MADNVLDPLARLGVRSILPYVRQQGFASRFRDPRRLADLDRLTRWVLGQAPRSMAAAVGAAALKGRYPVETLQLEALREGVAISAAEAREHLASAEAARRQAETESRVHSLHRRLDFRQWSRLWRS